MTMSETTRAQTTTRRRVVPRALGVVVATAAALVVWLLAVPVAGLELAANPQGAVQQIGPSQVSIISLGAGLVGWGVLALLERVVPARARLTWTILAVVVMVVSMFGPVGAGIGMGSKVVLSLLHLVVGVILIIALTRETPTHRG